MKTSEVMTHDVWTCAPHDTAADAARVMWDRDCGVVPVVSDGELKGVVTDRDLLMAAQTTGKTLAQIPLSSLVPGPVATCREDQDISEAMSTLSSRQVRRLPVVNRDNRLVGILSINDLATRAVGDKQRMLDVATTLAAVSRHRGLARAKK